MSDINKAILKVAQTNPEFAKLLQTELGKTSRGIINTYQVNVSGSKSYAPRFSFWLHSQTTADNTKTSSLASWLKQVETAQVTAMKSAFKGLDQSIRNKPELWGNPSNIDKDMFDPRALGIERALRVTLYATYTLKLDQPAPDIVGPTAKKILPLLGFRVKFIS